MRTRGRLAVVVVLLLAGGAAAADERSDLEASLRDAQADIPKVQARVDALRKEVGELDRNLQKRTADAWALRDALAPVLERLLPLEEEVRKGVEGAAARLEREKKEIENEIRKDAALSALRIFDLRTLRSQARQHSAPDWFRDSWRKQRKEKARALRRTERELFQAKKKVWSLQGRIAALDAPPTASPVGGVRFIAGWQMATRRVAVDMPVPLLANPGWWVLAPNGSLVSFHPEHPQSRDYLALLGPRSGTTTEEALTRFEAAGEEFGKLMEGGWIVEFGEGPVQGVLEDHLVRVEVDGRIRHDYRHPNQYGADTLGWIEFASLAETLPYAEGAGATSLTSPRPEDSTREGYHVARIDIATTKGDVYRASRYVEVERELLVDTKKDAATGKDKEIPVTTAYARARAAAVGDEQRQAWAKPIKMPDPAEQSPFAPPSEPAVFREEVREIRMHASTAEFRRVLEFLRKTPGCTAADMMKVLRVWAQAQDRLLSGPRWSRERHSPFTHMTAFVMGCKTVGTLEAYALLKHLAGRVRALAADEPRLASIADGLSTHLAGLSISVGAWDRAGQDMARVGKPKPWWPTVARLKTLAARLDTK